MNICVLNLKIEVNLYYDKRAKLEFYQLNLIKNLTLKIMFTIILFIVNIFFLIKRPLVISIFSFSFSTRCYFIWYILFSLYLFIYHQYHYYFPFRSYCYFSDWYSRIFDHISTQYSRYKNCLLKPRYKRKK